MCSLCNLVRTREDLAHNVHLLERYSDYAWEAEPEIDPGRYNLKNKNTGPQAVTENQQAAKQTGEEEE